MKLICEIVITEIYFASVSICIDRTLIYLFFNINHIQDYHVNKTQHAKLLSMPEIWENLTIVSCSVRTMKILLLIETTVEESLYSVMISDIQQSSFHSFEKNTIQILICLQEYQEHCRTLLFLTRN